MKSGAAQSVGATIQLHHVIHTQALKGLCSNLSVEAHGVFFGELEDIAGAGGDRGGGVG